MTPDEQARDALILQNMGYVRRIADRYRGRGVPIDDLRQEAFIGLCMAADRYDAEKHPNVPFEVLAGIWARKYVISALIEAGHKGMSRVPHRAIRVAGKCRAARERLIAAGDPDPPIERIAEEAGVRPAIARRALSIPGYATQAVAAGIFARLADPRKDRAADELWDALALCSRLEIAVVLKLWGLDGGHPMTPVQVARDLDLSTRDVLASAEHARTVMGAELRRKGWNLDRWERQFARSA